MKLFKAILWSIPVLGFVLAAVSMFFLPQVIPIQIGFSDGATRVGSKYFLFILPAISAFMAYRYQSPGENGRNSGVWGGLFIDLLVFVVEIAFIIIGLNYR